MEATTEANLSAINESLLQLSATLGRMAARQDQMLEDWKKRMAALAPIATTTPNFVTASPDSAELAGASVGLAEPPAPSPSIVAPPAVAPVAPIGTIAVVPVSCSTKCTTQVVMAPTTMTLLPWVSASSSSPDTPMISGVVSTELSSDNDVGEHGASLTSCSLSSSPTQYTVWEDTSLTALAHMEVSDTQLFRPFSVQVLSSLVHFNCSTVCLDALRMPNQVPTVQAIHSLLSSSNHMIHWPFCTSRHQERMHCHAPWPPPFLYLSRCDSSKSRPAPWPSFSDLPGDVHLTEPRPPLQKSKQGILNGLTNRCTSVFELWANRRFGFLLRGTTTEEVTPWLSEDNHTAVRHFNDSVHCCVQGSCFASFQWEIAWQLEGSVNYASNNLTRDGRKFLDHVIVNLGHISSPAVQHDFYSPSHCGGVDFYSSFPVSTVMWMEQSKESGELIQWLTNNLHGQIQWEPGGFWLTMDGENKSINPKRSQRLQWICDKGYSCLNDSPATWDPRGSRFACWLLDTKHFATYIVVSFMNQLLYLYVWKNGKSAVHAIEFYVQWGPGLIENVLMVAMFVQLAQKLVDLPVLYIQGIKELCVYTIAGNNIVQLPLYWKLERHATLNMDTIQTWNRMVNSIVCPGWHLGSCRKGENGRSWHFQVQVLKSRNLYPFSGMSSKLEYKQWDPGSSGRFSNASPTKTDKYSVVSTHYQVAGLLRISTCCIRPCRPQRAIAWGQAMFLGGGNVTTVHDDAVGRIAMGLGLEGDGCIGVYRRHEPHKDDIEKQIRWN